VKAILNDPALNINFAEPVQGFTALHIAAARNAAAIVRLLIATGKCDVSIKDKEGRTAARLAVVLADNPAVGRYLFDLEYGTPPEKRTDRSVRAAQRRAEN
jgi:ankyrin repeat protein